MDAKDLPDVEAIKQLKARYFRFIDTKQWDRLRTVFADDLVLIADINVPEPGEKAAIAKNPQGGDAIVAHFAEMLNPLKTVHHGHMPEITVHTANEGSGIWSMEDIVEYPGGMKLHGFGHYHERYRKQDGEWRIARLHLTRLRLDYSGMSGDPQQFVADLAESHAR